MGGPFPLLLPIIGLLGQALLENTHDSCFAWPVDEPVRVEETAVEYRIPEGLSAPELRDAWPLLAPQDRIEGFKLLPREDAEEFFLGLRCEDQLALLHGLAQAERMLWMRLLPPDDAVDLVQVATREERQALLALLD